MTNMTVKCSCGCNRNIRDFKVGDKTSAVVKGRLTDLTVSEVNGDSIICVTDSGDKVRIYLTVTHQPS